MHFALYAQLEKMQLKKLWIVQPAQPCIRTSFSMNASFHNLLTIKNLTRYKELRWKWHNCATNINLLIFFLVLELTGIHVKVLTWEMIKNNKIMHAREKKNADSIHWEFIRCLSTLYKMLLKYRRNAKPNVPFVSKIWALSQEVQGQKGSWLLGSIQLIIGLKTRLQLASCPLE